jgi:hypothetical protein
MQSEAPDSVSEPPETNFSHLMNVIDELNSAAYEVASYRELNRYLQHNLRPYTDKWQRRSLKVLFYSIFMSNSVTKLLKRNQNIFRAFNESVEAMTLRTRDNVNDVGKIIKDARTRSDSDYDAFLDELGNWVLMRGLEVGAVFEVCLVALFFFVVQVRERCAARKQRRKKRVKRS